jgi:hypothetical protein
MCEIQNMCVYIFFAMTIFVIMWSGGWMVKTLDCGQEKKVQTSLCTYHDQLTWLKIIMMMWQILIIHER